MTSYHTSILSLKDVFFWSPCFPGEVFALSGKGLNGIRIGTALKGG